MGYNMYQKYVSSPIGWLLLQTTEKALVSISFKDNPEENCADEPGILRRTEIQLKEYFEGKRKEFDLQLNPEGTPFQKKVWKFVSYVAFGHTVSYLDIAIQTGSEKNTRAVGMANGKNPIPIIIPCHRIIGSDKKLTGYAGGIERKRWLLQHELKFSENNNLLF